MITQIHSNIIGYFSRLACFVSHMIFEFWNDRQVDFAIE